MDYDSVAGFGVKGVRRAAILVVLVGLALLSATEVAGVGRRGLPYAGRVEKEVRSQYSHIRVRRQDSVRTLTFVRDTGEEVWETQMDLDKPHHLRFDYLRHMFLSYAFRPEHEKVLIVGLGGGSMVQFLKRYDPEVAVDAVEIDPAVVDIADKFFGVRSEGKVTVHTADALKFLENAETRYDVIYMDAFLKPSRATDTTGMPLHLKTVQFYRDLQKKIQPDGLVAFNLNTNPNTRADVAAIREAFANIYIFPLPGRTGCVVIASPSEKREATTALRANAKKIDARFKADFSFESMIRRVGR